MKTQKFQMRISAETREQLNTLKQRYQMSASAVICMLISKEVMKFNMLDGNKVANRKWTDDDIRDIEELRNKGLSKR